MSHTPSRPQKRPTTALLSLYRLVLAPLGPLVRLLAATARDPDRRREWDERAARKVPSMRPRGIWIHGASVGEARLTRALAGELRRRRPGLPLGVSAMTRTGREMLPAPPDVDAAFFLPLDLVPLPGRVLDAVRPCGMTLVETELWPNLLEAAADRGVPACVVNGRLSPERMERYRRYRGLFAPLLGGLSRIGAASDEEAARFVEIGARPEAVSITGNMKYDVPEPAVNGSSLRRRFGLPSERPVVVAGSTGPGEDRIVLVAYEAARQRHPGLFLVLAPRHPERFAAVRAEAVARGLSVHALSARADGVAGSGDVLLVDTVGELATLYALGDAAFVGGSLVPVGGHNLLEPVAARVPVVYGPHLHHVTEMADVLERGGAGIRVRDAAGLSEAWSRLLLDRAFRRVAVEAGSAVLDHHRGAVARSADIVLAAAESAPESAT